MTDPTPLTGQQLDELSDTLYDALYAITPYAETYFADETEGLKNAVRAVLAQAAAQRWIGQQENQLGIKWAEFRAGNWEMGLAAGRDFAAAYVAAARALLGDAPNYSETKLEFDVKIAESPEMYTLVVQRHAPGALTPHEARQKAEARVAELEQAMAQIRHLHKDSPMGPCPVCIDADAVAAGGDGLVSYPCPTGRLAGAEDCDPPGSGATQQTTPDPLAYGPTGIRCGCGKDAHSNLTPCQPMTADEWNARYPVGTPVTAYPGSRGDAPLVTKTRTPAWALGHGAAVVSVDGHAGGIALTRIEPRAAADSAAAEGAER